MDEKREKEILRTERLRVALESLISMIEANRLNMGEVLGPQYVYQELQKAKKLAREAEETVRNKD